MTKEKNSRQLDPQRWGTIFTLLSLDYTQAFMASMGLDIPEKEPFKEVVRDSILKSREHLTAPEEESPELTSMIFEACRARFGNKFVVTLMIWGDRIFKYSGQDQLDLRHWQFILAVSRKPTSRWDKLFRSPEHASEVLLHFNQALNADDIYTLDEMSEKEPKSLWDLHMYARHRLDEDTRSPFMWIINTVRSFRFRQFWVWLCDFLPTSELDYLFEAGKRAVQEVEGLKFINVLRHPRAVTEDL